MDEELEVVARLEELGERKAVIKMVLEAGGEIRAEIKMVAVAVKDDM